MNELAIILEKNHRLAKMAQAQSAPQSELQILDTILAKSEMVDELTLTPPQPAKTTPPPAQSEPTADPPNTANSPPATQLDLIMLDSRIMTALANMEARLMAAIKQRKDITK